MNQPQAECEVEAVQEQPPVGIAFQHFQLDRMADVLDAGVTHLIVLVQQYARRIEAGAFAFPCPPLLIRSL